MGHSETPKLLSSEIPFRCMFRKSEQNMIWAGAIKQVPNLTYDDVTIMPRGGEEEIHRYWDIEGEGSVV